MTGVNTSPDYFNYIGKSMNLKVALLIIFIIFLVCVFYVIGNSYDDIKTAVSTVDGKTYHVRHDELYTQNPPEFLIPRQQQISVADTGASGSATSSATMAADYLAMISNKIGILVRHMYNNKLPNEETANRLYSRWSKCRLRETNSKESSVAYTVNKGDEMRLCIRKNGALENMNTSIFVILHELAHIMSVSYGHNEEFRENFSYITHLAASIGVYIPENFISDPVDYCGTIINTTPCSDGTCNFSQ